jgi:hypothetical protein
MSTRHCVIACVVQHRKWSCWHDDLTVAMQAASFCSGRVRQCEGAVKCNRESSILQRDVNAGPRELHDP